MRLRTTWTQPRVYVKLFARSGDWRHGSRPFRFQGNPRHTPSVRHRALDCWGLHASRYLYVRVTQYRLFATVAPTSLSQPHTAGQIDEVAAHVGRAVVVTDRKLHQRPVALAVAGGRVRPVARPAALDELLREPARLDAGVAGERGDARRASVVESHGDVHREGRARELGAPAEQGDNGRITSCEVGEAARLALIGAPRAARAHPLAP
eukprot:2834148-Prymnesium_polylepis.1